MLKSASQKLHKHSVHASVRHMPCIVPAHTLLQKSRVMESCQTCQDSEDLQISRPSFDFERMSVTAPPTAEKLAVSCGIRASLPRKR